MRGGNGLKALALAAGMAGQIGAAAAADLSPAAAPAPAYQPPPAWRYEVVLYGWATALNGDIGVRDLPAASVDVPFTDLVQNLDGALMGAFVARNGDWTLLADLVWSKLSADQSAPNIGPLGSQFGLSQKLAIASGIVGHRLPVGGDNLDLSATVGFRYQRLTVDTDLTFIGAPFVTLSDHDVKDWLDPVIGLLMNYRFSEHWFANAYADIGGFGVGSKLTSQSFLAVGYNWSESWSTALGYRALYTDYQDVTAPDRNFRYDVWIHGPYMSLAYHF